ncbi:MAG: protein-tyrosine phosphatase family protein [Actinomycetota bacterium]
MSYFDGPGWEDDPWDRASQAALFWTIGKDSGDRSGPPVWRTCDHWRQRFDLENNLSLYASAWTDRPSKKTQAPRTGLPSPPDIGLYLDSVWASDALIVSSGLACPVSHAGEPGLIIFPWRDWSVPEDPALLRKVLLWLLDEIQKGKMVEIGCIGGHGRTGTALACLLVLQGVPGKKAIRRVRRDYCELAIESQRQLELIKSFA